MTYNTKKFDEAINELENVLDKLKKATDAIIKLKPAAKDWEIRHLK